MKKLVVLFMCFCLVFIAACSSSNSNNNSQSTNTNTSTTQNSGSETTPEPAKEQKTVKLRIYAQYSDDDTKTPYDYAVSELKKEMPFVELELEVQAQDDGQKLKTYAATGNLPDIYQAGLDIINTFKKSGNILELDSYVEQFGFKDQMHQSTLNTLYTEDGHAYTFPYAGNEFMLLYYNKDLFEKHNVTVPTTYDELMDAINKFNAAGIAPLSVFAKEKWPTVALYDYFVTRLDPGGVAKVDKGQANITDAPYVEAAEKLVEMVKAGLLPKGATNLNYDQAAALFYEEKAAMFLNGQWEIPASTEKLGDKVSWMYFPGIDAANYETSKNAFSGGGGPSGYAVNPDTKDPELAAKVAAFLSLKYAEYKYTHRGNPLVATKVDKDIVVEYPPMMQKLSEAIPSITSTTAFAWGLSDAKFKAAIEDATQSLMTGAYSAEQFIKDVSKAVPSGQ